MKRRLLKLTPCLAALLVGLIAASLQAQSGDPPHPADAKAPPRSEGLTRFNLDFPGGTPKELAAAIQKALNRRLNVIVPDEFESVKLPSLKMEHIDVAELFKALQSASRKDEAVTTGNGGYPGGYQSYQVTQTGYGFKPGNEQDKPTDDTIWYFYVTKPVLPPLSAAPVRMCRFYSLAPYLDRGLTVDDITTAIETGWKMLGANTGGFGSSAGTMSFHKDTKLLIAVGEPSKLETIDAVLRALDSTPKQWGAIPPPPSAVPSPNPLRNPAAPVAPKPPERPRSGQ